MKSDGDSLPSKGTPMTDSEAYLQFRWKALEDACSVGLSAELNVA